MSHCCLGKITPGRDEGKSPKEGACCVEGPRLMCLKSDNEERVTGDDFHFERVPVQAVGGN